MDPNALSSSASDVVNKLTKLIFDDPNPTAQGYFKTTATYTNDEKQAFRVHINCRNRKALDRYTPEVYAHFKLRPATSEEARVEGNDQSEALPSDRPDQILTLDEPEHAPDLDISIRVEDTAGIKPPYVLDFAIDPLIGFNEVHTYGLSNVHGVRMNAKGVQNKVEVSFFGRTPRDPVILEENHSVDPPLIEPQSNTAFSFRITVKGMEGDNKYTLSGDVKRLAADHVEGVGFIEHHHE